ncbi:MAG: hypothetical protein ACSHUF_00070 [Candidatus Nasuia deltocephalinicola]
MNFFNMSNKEKKKNILKIEIIKLKKNLLLYIKKGGCYDNKYYFSNIKRIFKNNLIIIKKKKIVFNEFNSYINSKGIKIISKKNKVKIKNKKIRSICDCKFSFNF